MDTKVSYHSRQPFGGYHATSIPAPDLELAQVGPRTPGGEYLRRFWHPIALISELGELPLPIRVLGENLVLFKTTKGEIGLLHEHCSHRGTSLIYGRPTDAGLRCCYHGWLFAPNGRVLEMPGESATSKIYASHYHGAYPTRSYKGLVFAYLGPPEECPDFPIYDTFEWPDTEDAAFSHHFPCNWLQIHENCMDPYHATWLHALHSGPQFTPAWGETPLLDWRETPLGLTTATVRRVGDNVWMTAVDAILPNMRQTGFWEDAKNERFFARSALSLWITPIDDTNSLMIGLRFYNKEIDPYGLGRKELCGKESSDAPGQTGLRSFEEKQREPGDWEANTGQRPIAIHSMERLGATDRGITLLRRQLREGIRAVQRGEQIAMAKRDAQGKIPTYVHDSILTVPALTDPIAEASRMRILQTALADIVLDQAMAPSAERTATVRARMVELRTQHANP